MAPRSATTAGSPRRTTSVPAGSSGRTATSTTTSATAAAAKPSAGSGASGEVEPDHGDRRPRRQRQPTDGGRPGRLRAVGDAAQRGQHHAVAATESATTPRNTQRQPYASATTPATLGPTIDGITQAAAKAPKIRDGRSGRRCARPDVERDGHRPGAQPLQEPRGHEQLDPRRQPREQQPAREHRHRGQQRQLAARSGPTTARRRPSPPRWPRASRRTPPRTRRRPCRSALTVGMIVVTASASKAARKTRLTMPIVAQR